MQILSFFFSFLSINLSLMQIQQQNQFQYSQLAQQPRNKKRTSRAHNRQKQLQLRFKVILRQLKVTRQEGQQMLRIFHQQKWQRRRTSDLQTNQRLSQLRRFTKQKTIRQQIIISINNFITSNKNRISFKIENKDLQIKIGNNQNNEVPQSLLYINQLQNSMKKCLAPQVIDIKQVSDQIINKKVTQLFRGLFQCLKCFLKIQIDIEHLHNLDSLDFLYFPNNHRQNTNYHHIPIFIGGLRFTCMKFYRKLIQIILSRQQYLLNDIISRFDPNLTQQNRQQLITEYRIRINNKYNLLKQYRNQPYEQQHKKQMTLECPLFQQVLHEFNEQLFNLFLLKQYESFRSYKTYQLQSTFNEANRKSQIRSSINPQAQKLRPINIKLSAKLIKPSFRQLCQNKKIQISELRNSNLFNEILEYNQNDNFLNDNNIFYHGKNQYVQIVFYSTGEFHLIGLNQQQLKQFKIKLELLYSKEVDNCSYNYCYKGNLGIQCQPSLLNRISLFRDKLSGFLRTQIRMNINKRRKQRIQTCISIEKRQAFIEERQILAQCSKFQQFIRYSHSHIKNFGQKAYMTIDITPKGDIRIIGSQNLQQTQKVLKIVKNKIQQQLTKDFQQMKFLSQERSNCYQIKFPGNSSHISEYLQHSSKFPVIRLSQDDKFRIKSLQFRKGAVPVQQTIIDSKTFQKIKILTWNLQTGKYKYRKASNQRQKQEKFLIWEKRKRFQQIIKVIKQQQADFICLQQGSFIFENTCLSIYKEIVSYLENQNDCKYYLAGKQDKYFPNSRVNKGYFRTIILSKIPAKFYEVEFIDHQSDFMTMCCFKIIIDGKPLNTLLASIHLKSGYNRERRQKQLKILKQISLNFDFTILAGDFNIGQQYRQDQLLRQYFNDIINFMPSNYRPNTYVDDKFQPNRFDRIVTKFNVQKNNQLIKYQNSFHAYQRLIGNMSCLPYQNHYEKQSQVTKKQTSLSDHYGVCAQITFKKHK